MRLWPRFALAVAAFVGLGLPLRAQTYEVIHVFAGSDGEDPRGTLLQVGTDFYGTTVAGGDPGVLCSSGCGMAFRLDASNVVTPLHAFDPETEGTSPLGGLTAGGDGTLAAEGITAGCGNGDFCPGNPVTRAQMAVFLLKIEHGSSYVPPVCTGLFADVGCPSLFADWVEQLFAEGITAGCS